MLQTLGGSSLTIIMLICVLYLSWYSILWFHDNIVTLSNPIWYQHWRWPCWGHDTSTLFFMNYRWWYLFLWEVLLLQAGWGGLCKWLDDGGVPDIVAPRSHELAYLETSVSEDLPWGTQGQVWHHWYARSVKVSWFVTVSCCQMGDEYRVLQEWSGASITLQQRPSAIRYHGHCCSWLSNG